MLPYQLWNRVGTKDRKSPWFQGVKNSNTTTTCSRSWSFPSFLGLSAGPLMYIYCLIHYIQTNFPSNSLLTSPLSSDQLFCFPTKNSRPSRNIIYHDLTSCNKLSYHSWKWQPSRKKKNLNHRQNSQKHVSTPTVGDPPEHQATQP